MSQESLIELVQSRCEVNAIKIYIDPTTLKGKGTTRIKLLGARISDSGLWELQGLRDKIIATSEGIRKIVCISRNEHSTGGRFTSVNDVCIYLQ